jgi:NAD(P)-dependent dehydrogenase (short-subunit alcohol dehydrogenase family)
MRLKPLKEQIVVVMGASSGIGRATALDFAAHGATVVCAARDERGLATLVEEIRAKGGRALAFTAEVADPDQMKNVADRAAQTLGRIDTWVQVAAVMLFARFEDTSPAEFARMIEVNLLGQIHGALAALPHLRRAGRGALVSVSSIEGKVSFPLQSAYAASKHGVVGFLDALRLELQREGVPISVTNIMPSGINTPLYQKALTRLGVEPRPTAPVYAPELVSRAILHAASHEAREIVVGGAGHWLLLAQRLSPTLADAILRTRIGVESQLTDLRRSADAPNNLFKPSLARYAHVEGDHGTETLRRSLATQLSLSRAADGVRWITRGVSEITAKVAEAGWILSLPKVARKSLARRLVVRQQRSPKSG